MKMKSLYKKIVMLLVLLFALGWQAKATESRDGDQIVFADDNVKALCVANWDTNSDGELSYAEAAAVSDLGTVFRSKSNITTFDELQYFTGLDTIGDYAFYNCSYLTSIVIPNSVTYIDTCAFYFCNRLPMIVIPNSVTAIEYYAFYYCRSLSSMIVWTDNPPVLGSDVFGFVEKTIPIYVSCASSQAFQNAEGWNVFSNILEMCPGVITVSSNAAEYGTVNGGGYYEGGEICTLTATPNAGYYFAYWSENGNEISNEEPYSFRVIGDRTLVANFVADDIIVFDDDNVKDLCVANWDTDGDGELSYAEADAVTDLGTVFKSKSNITSFNELQYFTGLTFIGENAFSSCRNLTSVVIPNFVTYIGNNAFSYCSGLTSVTIPSSVTVIRTYAFRSCSSLTSITIPNSVVYIYNDAFRGCSGLTSITIPNSVTSIGATAFSGCLSVEQIVVDAGNPVYDSRNNCNAIINTSTNALVFGCKNTVIPDSVTSIASSAFKECTGLISITIPNSVTFIGNSAFYGCSGLTSVSIGNSLASMDSYPFGYCPALEQITVASDNEVYDSRENCNAIINTSTNELVVGCKNTVIPNSVTSIGRYAIYGCSTLTSITIPDSVTSIGTYAFASCSGLASVSIGQAVTTIERYAFYSCSSLTSVTIPNAVTTIEESAFYGCSGLTSIIAWPENPPVVEARVFVYVDKTIPVYVPCASLEAYQNAEGWNEFSNFLEMCPSVITATANVAEYGTVTGGGSYEGGATCTLTAIPNQGYFFSYWSENGVGVSNEEVYSFTVAGDRTLVANFVADGIMAFADANVKDLCVANWDTNGDGELSYAEADAVTDLGTLFKYNTNVTSFDELQYFTGLTSIGYQAFYGCTNLTSIVIPNSVTNIGQYAFCSCENLISIVVPNSVTSLEGNAFSYCYELTSAVISNSLLTIGERAFENCRNLISITIPKSVNSIGTLVFSGCYSLEQIVVDAANLVYDSRDNCNAIIMTSNNKLIVGCMNTVIPNTVISLGDGAFSGCNGLVSIAIPNSVTTIGNSVFYTCSGLTSVNVGSSLASIGNSAFGYCPALEQITVASDNEVYDSRDGCNAIIKTSTNELVVGCKSTVIPSSVTSIGNYSFNGSGLTSIDIPDSVITIGQYAFSSSKDMTSARVGNSVTSIGKNGFSNCTNLATIILGSSVSSLGDNTFSSCSKMASMMIWAETPPAVGSSALSSIKKTIPLYVPCGFSQAYQNAEGWSNFRNCHEMCPGVITVTANNTEYGTVTGGGSYEGGETCTVTATPNEGYFFAYWSEDGGGVSNEETYSFIVAGDRTLVANFIEDGIITFADTNVKTLCLNNWDTNEDGELSYLEANAVTDLGTVFKSNKTITSFDELQYFTGLTFITSYAFSGCTALTSVVIPNSVAEIRSYAFEGCSALTSVVIPNSVVSLINGAFIRCSGLTSITLPNSLHTIGDNALSNCSSLTAIDIPNSVLSIERNAFASDTSLTSITIPSSVTSIGSNPVLGCSSLEQIVVDAGNTVYDSRNNCNAIIKTSTNALIGGCKNTIIPNTVSTIESGAFYGCTGLTSIDIPNSVTRIEGSVFYNCTSLTSVSIPNSVTYLGSSVFNNCSSLTSASIGNSVTSIQYDIFSNCPALGQITVALDNVVYDSRENCNAIIKTSTNELIAGCKDSFIPNTVTSIGYRAFYNCTNLTSIVIPGSVSSIGQYAFAHCTGLTSIDISDSVTSIGKDAFEFCNVLTSINIPNSLTTIEQYTFAYCYALTSITIPDSVTSIAKSAFYSCRGLISVTIGKAVTSIGDDVFSYCNGLTSITVLAETPPTLGSKAFYRVSKTIPLYVPYGCAELYRNAAGWNEFTNIIELCAFRFITAGTWGNASNWSGGVLPAVNDSVSIDANCTLNKNVTVKALSITAGNTLTLQKNKTLIVTNTLTNTSEAGLVIKDGAQLINATENVAATMEKKITAYSNNNPDGWYTIASPMNDMDVAGSDFVTYNYDLYRYNEASLSHQEWENYKADLADFTTFENGRGYLYANGNTISPTFTGTLNASSVTLSLTFTERPDDSFSGFNLIGNPFPHEIYKGAGGAIDDANLASGYYTLTNEGIWEAHTFDDAILPGQGILVKATTPTVLTIYKSNEEAYAETGEAKTEARPLRIGVEGDNGKDRVYVYFGQGVGLDKVEDFSQSAPGLALHTENGDYAIAHVGEGCKSLELLFDSHLPGEFTLSVNVKDITFSYLHLIDSVTGSDIDMLQQPSYVFKTTGQEPADRFRLVFVR